jgi:hypothetical protein
MKERQDTGCERPQVNQGLKKKLEENDIEI